MRVLIGLEMQIPYENPKLFRSFLDFAKDFNPERIVVIGDFLDVPGPARWNRGTALEFRGTLGMESRRGYEYLRELRGLVGSSTVIDFHEGNHEKRIQSYVRNKAPAFEGLDVLSIPSLLRFDELGINLLPDVSPLAQGWVTTHGDVVASTVSRTSGGTALIQARKIGKSVICGHTHRLGMINEQLAGKSLTGVETGHMMDLNKASYVYAPNWQAGFAAVEISENKVQKIHLTKLNSQGKISW